MFRKTLASGFLGIALVCSPFASLADEGMWLPDALDKLPQEQLRKRGLQLRPDEIYSKTRPSLKDAIVRISSGGTGSFVSPEGLILTNHHIAFTAVTRASSTEQDYINQGFLAKARAEEIPARGYTISVLQDYEDVTNSVLSVARPEMSPEERQSALEDKRQELAKTALNGRDKDGLQTQVVEATSGLQYFLYTYLTVRDVRLVYAPPKSIGYFGGDPITSNGRAIAAISPFCALTSVWTANLRTSAKTMYRSSRRNSCRSAPLASKKVISRW